LKLEVEPEDVENADEKGRYILRCGVKKAAMEIKNKKFTGNYDVTKLLRRAFTECLCNTPAPPITLLVLATLSSATTVIIANTSAICWKLS
jgi:hypothetical protein